MIDFTNYYAVREWLDGAVTFFWIAIFASYFGRDVVYVWDEIRNAKSWKLVK